VTVRRSACNRRRAISFSPDATLRASTGKVTVQISRATSIGICATFCA
jgi:hypothetical protein